MRLRILASVLIALTGCAVLAAIGRAQDATLRPITHHSAPITVQLTIAETGQPVTMTLLLDIETTPGNFAEPAVKLKITPKRTLASDGITLGTVAVGDIQSVDFIPTSVATTTTGLLPTPTPVVTATGGTMLPLSGKTAESTVNDVANLRKGPGTEFAVVGQAKAGDAVTLVGQTKAGDWYQLSDDSWIAAFLVDGAPANLPVVAAAATPAATVTATPVPATRPALPLIPSPTPTGASAVTGNTDG